MAGSTGVDGIDQVRMGLPSDKGLKIEPVPGGLYRVRNLAGGVAPAPMGGLHNELQSLLRLVRDYNSKVK